MRVLGALTGVAVGDALGATVEFMDAETIRKQYGKHTEIIGGGWLKLKAGEITDDTQMTFAVARGILKNPNDPILFIGDEFIRWVKTGPKDIGSTCGSAIGRFMTSLWTWPEASKWAHNQHGGKSAGNGALMRCIYPALFYKEDQMAEAITMAQAEMTHYDKQSTEACRIYCRIIRRFLKLKVGAPRAAARMAIYDETIGTPYESANLWARDDINPTGYVVDSMKAALWAFVKSRSFEECLVRAVNLGGDADTIGAIAGGLAGAWYGIEEIPTRWTTALQPAVQDELAELTYQATKNRGGSVL